MRRRARGFTLLEVMIATAILAGVLTWVTVGLVRSVRAENHAKMLTTATFLARAKMSDFEDELYEKGFGEFDKETSGGFEDRGFSKFGWKITVDKVEFPSGDKLQSAITKAQQLIGGANGDDKSKSESSKASSSSSSSNPAGGIGAAGMMGAFGFVIEIVRTVFETGVRRVTVTIFWTEGSRRMELPVVAYFTDVRKVDQAINLSLPTNIPGAGGGTGGNPNPTPTPSPGK
jgi:prepilin-type N-terminal cleavage/methylation domain-containing protein